MESGAEDAADLGLPATSKGNSSDREIGFTAADVAAVVAAVGCPTDGYLGGRERRGSKPGTAGWAVSLTFA